jgi:hypothetical protein
MLDRGSYMAGIKGLAVHAGILTSVEHERLREHAANLEVQAKQLLEQRERSPFDYADAGVATATIDADAGTAEAST